MNLINQEDIEEEKSRISAQINQKFRKIQHI